MGSKKVAEEKCDCDHGCCQPSSHQGNSAGGGAVYGLGIFGAAFYFFPYASGVSEFFMAILKSLVWPALLVFEALKLLHS